MWREMRSNQAKSSRLKRLRPLRRKRRPAGWPLWSKVTVIMDFSRQQLLGRAREAREAS